MIQLLRKLFQTPPNPIGQMERRAPMAPPPQAAATAAPVTPVRNYFEALNVADHRTPVPAMGPYVFGKVEVGVTFISEPWGFRSDPIVTQVGKDDQVGVKRIRGEEGGG